MVSQTTSLTLLDVLRESNDQHAWHRFVQIYHPLLHFWAARQGFQPADAADLVQNVLLKLMVALPSYSSRPGQTFRGWLFAIVRTQAHDFRRRKATRALPQGTDPLEVGAEKDSNVEEMEEAEYRGLLMRRAMDLVRADFSATTWKAFEAVAQQGQAASDVAKNLGISENAVYLARNRVLTRLRQELTGLLD